MNEYAWKLLQTRLDLINHLMEGEQEDLEGYSENLKSATEQMRIYSDERDELTKSIEQLKGG